MGARTMDWEAELSQIEAGENKPHLTLVISGEPKPPIESMRDNSLLWSWAESKASWYEACLQFWYFAMLTSLGSIIAPRVMVDIGMNVWLRLYTRIVGEPGDSHKSFAWTHTMDFLDRYFTAYPPLDDTYPMFHRTAGAGSGEGLAEDLGDYKHMLMYADEHATTVAKMRVPNSVLESLFTSLFESTTWRSRVKGKKTELTDVHFSYGCSTTTDQHTSAGGSVIGLDTRFVDIYGKRLEKKIPKAFPADLTAKFEMMLRDLVDFLSIPHVLTVEPAAFDAMDHWYKHELPDGRESHRIDGIAWRFAGLLTVVDGHTSIDAATMRRGIRLADYVRQNRIFLSSGGGSETKDAEAENMLLAKLKLKGPYSYSEASQFSGVRQRYGTPVFKKAWQNLSEAGDIIPVDPKDRLGKFTAR